MAIVQSKKQKPETPENQIRIDENLMEPGKYEITPESVFEVDLYLFVRNKRWIIATGEGTGVDSHKLVFMMWNYDEMIDLKKKATIYDTGKRIHMVDQDFLNRLKVQKLLLSWTLDKDNPRLKLHRIQGTLTDESWTIFSKLQPNIIIYILDRMNAILEYNA